MSGGSKTQTVGYWYRPTWEAVLCAGPVDAVRRFEAGDQLAWTGAQTTSGEIAIDKPELWGGEGGEGGVQGNLAVRMGDAAQAAGADGQRHRGVVTLGWGGWRWGAMNPYPKPFAALVERVLEGWPGDEPWYADAAAVMTGPDAAEPELLIEAFASSAPYSGDVGSYAWGSSSWGGAVSLGAITTSKTIVRGLPALSGTFTSIALRFQITIGSSADDAVALELLTAADAQIFAFVPRREDFYDATRRAHIRVGSDGGLVPMPSPLPGSKWLRLVVEWNGSGAWTASVLDVDTVISSVSGSSAEFLADAAKLRLRSDASGGKTSVATSYADLRLLGAPRGIAGMNPAHLIYYSLVSPTMQGEPVELVDDASFRAAADVFAAEGLGVCTLWDPDQETAEALRERICDAAGAACSRSPRDGKWYLRAIRGAGDPESLPTLTDDDILDIEVEPGVLDDAVNQVAVRWKDPLTHQDRTTAPVHALGAIDAGVNAQTLDYMALPSEDLANRVAERELRVRATPLARLTLTCTRKPYAWLRGEYFRVVAPKNGIVGMVCMVGDIDRGTLRSGAIKIVALQDVYTLPATSVVQAQPPVVIDGVEPVPVAEGALMEVPYAVLAAQLSATELAALAADAGYLLAYGPRPAAGLWNYRLHTRPAGGSYAAAGTFDWCPAASIVEPSETRLEAAFTLEDGALLDRVAPGTAALWGSEIVRVDAIDAEAGTLTLGRGCWDTVPQLHAAGARVFFFGSWYGSDEAEYFDGETANAKLQSRSGTAVLALDAAPELSLTFDRRANRPYPPAALHVNGAPYPSTVTGTITVTWAHRDRVAQADVLLDTTAASVGPEAATQYACYLYDDVSDALLAQEHGIGGTSWTTVAPAGRLRIEVESSRGGVACWQRHAHAFVHSDGLLLAEDGGALVTERGDPLSQESAPFDVGGFAHRATFALSGAHDTRDRLTLEVGFGSTRRGVDVPATGTASLAEFAAAAAAEFTAIGLYAAAEGTSVRVYATVPFVSVFARSSWAEQPAARVVQDAAAPDAGGPQWTFIDLYSSSTLVALCPSSAAALATAGVAEVAIDVRKRLRGAAPITGGSPIPGTPSSYARRFTLSWYCTSMYSDYLHQIAGLVDDINANADLAANDITASLSMLTPPPASDHEMSRPSVLITAGGDYAVSMPGSAPGQGAPLPVATHPSGYVPGIAEFANLGPAIPSGLPQISAVSLRADVGYAYAAGQKWWIDVDGTEYVYTLAGGETGEDIADAFAALIDPGGDWAVTWEAPDALVTATAVDTPFACTSWASYGVRVTATIDS
ncbi:MAG: hypothetical protein IAE86_06485 [Burkholderiaceae bacterium]|nr:hypothetical protein [Burkholderiaceae bacterium]